MRKIALSRGQYALVDDGDFEWLSLCKWSALWAPSARTFYAVRTIYLGGGRQEPRQKFVYMHREIAAAAGLARVDHRDGDGLNNRRLNLRPCTNSQNLQNRRRQSNNKSGFKGVGLIRGTRKYRAYLTVNRKQITLGSFDVAADAARAYDAEALIRFGEYARLNFPPEASA